PGNVIAHPRSVVRPPPARTLPRRADDLAATGLSASDRGVGSGAGGGLLCPRPPAASINRRGVPNRMDRGLTLPVRETGTPTRPPPRSAAGDLRAFKMPTSPPAPIAVTTP